MKMSGRVMSCCVVLLLTVTSASSLPRLDSIDDLIQTDRSLYGDIYALLQWFANTAQINDNAIWLTFDPQRGDYSSHFYGNYEELLPYNSGHRYYTLGNARQESQVKLPQNVINHNRNRGNRVRIIVGINRLTPGCQAQRIDRVYITQHYVNYSDDESGYHPDHTYEISTWLLRQIGDNQRLQTGFREQSARYTSQSYNYGEHRQENQWSVMNALLKIFLFILLAFVILIILANSSQPKRQW